MHQSHLRQALCSVPGDEGDRVFTRALQSIRRHLAMEVAFVSEFNAGRRYFRSVDSGREGEVIQPGGSDPLEDSYCQRIADGRLPELMRNAWDNAEACTLPATKAVPVGAHLSVPIRLSDGRTYGTFCCFSTVPNYDLNDRDLNVMRAFAEVVAEQIERTLAEREEAAKRTQRIESALQSEALSIVYQPILDIARSRVVGFEALSRFATPPRRPPDVWFAEAASVGRGVELECQAIRLALSALDRLPAWAYLSVNASPATLMSGMLEELLADVDLSRVVVEITEHEAVHHYNALSAAFAPLRARGLRLAIDDAGAGYASFRHILNLEPHMIKLDVSITRDVHVDRFRRALAAALCRFAEETNCRIVAEGVQKAEELATLRELGFDGAQGHFLGHPEPLPKALELCRGQEGPVPPRLH